MPYHKCGLKDQEVDLTLIHFYCKDDDAEKKGDDESLTQLRRAVNTQI